MKTVFALIIAAVLVFPAHAQFSIATIQDPYNASNAALHLPCFLGDGFRRVQVSLMNTSFGLSSNFATMADAREFLRSSEYSDDLIRRSLSAMHETNNRIAGGLDMALVNVAVNLGSEDGDVKVSLGAGINERIALSTYFNRNTFLFAYAGNKQFAGEFVQLAPRFDALAFAEYYVAAAFDIRSGGEGWSIKPAVRLSYLTGQASVDMQQQNDISVYTDPQGRYLDFSLNYNINTSLGQDSVTLDGSTFNVNEKSIGSGLGSGIGADLALRLSPHPGLQFCIGVMDLGSIHFSHATNMYNHSTYRYEGVEVDFTDNQSLNLDSLSSFARPQYSHNEYSVRLPGRLILAGSLGLGAAEAAAGTYFHHQLSALYVQGFKDHLGSTTVPYVGLGYTYAPTTFLHLGVNAGVGGSIGFQLGLVGSVKAGPLLLGLQSGNLLALVSPRSGRGADGGFLLAFAF